MPLLVACDCGTSYDLREEFAGRLVKCPRCGRENRVPEATRARGQADAAFERDVFLLRQQLMRISEKYDVGDEHGNPVVFVERPAHLLRNLGALLAGAAVLIVAAVVLVWLARLLTEGEAREIASALAFLVALVPAALVAFALSAKRHVTFYRDASKAERLLEVLQDKKFQLITVTYTIRDAAGQTLALLRKNRLSDILRKKWSCLAPDGTPLAFAREDSIVLSLLRRLLGPFLGLLRTNFVIQGPDGRTELGEFKRKFTILDRYVLDLSADRERTLDRRIGLALGVMLDTGERR